MTQSPIHDSPPEQLVLAADVGGTKTLLQLRRIGGMQEPDGAPVAEQRYASPAFDSLEAMVKRFLDESGQPLPHSACFAVAGPLAQEGERQSARLTNLPWRLDTAELSTRLGIPRITLLNDFQAIGYSLGGLTGDDLVPLHAAAGQAQGPRLVVGAGTGLGVCLVVPGPEDVTCYPSEGGHIAFAPRDEEQQALLDFMLAGSSRVSYERLVSGSGLVAIYRFLLHRSHQQTDPLLETDDPAAAIGGRAVAGDHPLAVEAVALFSRLYGAFAGDLALACLPTGGVYIAGGIAPKLLSCLQQGGFMQAFFDKGRMTDLMRRFPVQVITNTRSGLLGAAHYAARP